MSATNGGQQQPQPATPQIGVLAQYVKDLSFENPHAPRSLAPSAVQPAINIQINVDAAPVSETDFEVTLRLEGKADAQGLVLYSFELVRRQSSKRTQTVMRLHDHRFLHLCQLLAANSDKFVWTTVGAI